MKKQCPICGKDFEDLKHPNKKYCSLQCSGIAQRKGKTLNCAYCGKLFYKAPSLIKDNKQVFCSNECRYLAERKKDFIYLKADYAYIVLQKDNIYKEVLFDIEDIEKIKQYKWHLHLRKKDMRYDACANTYGNHKNRKYINMPRYILNCPITLTIDHLNHNTLDNRKQNLKICSSYENNQNKRINTSGCVGVCWDKARNKWHVMFRNQNLGRFDTFEEAVKIRKQAEENYHLQNNV